MVVSKSKGSMRLNKEAMDKWTNKFSEAEKERKQRQQQQEQQQSSNGRSAASD